jgi:nucleotide-binding universal stress UspA family protein
MNLLIAYDGSESAEVALQDLARAGLPRIGEAAILYVADAWTPGTPLFYPAVEGFTFPDPEPTPAVMEEAWQVAQTGAQRARELLPGWGVRPDAVQGPAAATIIDRARRWPADLVVLGSRGESGVARLVHGSVAHTVLSHPPCSIRIARVAPDPPGQEPRRGVRILLGFDGSANCEAAVCAVCARSWPDRSVVRLVTALDSQISSLMPVYTVEGTLTGQGLTPLRRSADEAADALRAAGLIVTTLVEPALPARMLVDEARRWTADVIFVGSRGLGPLGRLFLGGVSRAVAEHAGCTVEVIRPREIRPPTPARAWMPVPEEVCRETPNQ